MSALLTPTAPAAQALPPGPPTLPKAIGDDVTTVVPAHHAAARPELYRFTLADYLKMGEAGILDEDSRVELIDGIVERKPVENPPHAAALDELIAFMMQFRGESWTIRTQNQVNLDNSASEPDIAICREDPDDYITRHPTPADVGLLIEVADSSLLRDQRDKARIYARAAVACYWVVNLVERRVEVHTNPSGPTATPAYASVIAYAPGDAVPLVLDGVQVATIPATDLLP